MSIFRKISSNLSYRSIHRAIVGDITHYTNYEISHIYFPGVKCTADLAGSPAPYTGTVVQRHIQVISLMLFYQLNWFIIIILPIASAAFLSNCRKA